MGQINTRYYDCILICLFCADHVYFYWYRNVLCVYHSIENPVKTYIRGVFAALIFIFFVNILNALVVANVVPKGQMELNNIAQSISIYCQILGLPHLIVNLFSLLVFIGVAVQLSAWASGPAKTVTESARKGAYPPKFNFWKTNQFDVSKSVILTQSVIISIFALFYLLIPGVNQAFLMLVNSTTVIYCIVYVIMGIAVLRLRYTHAKLNRPFRIGKKRKEQSWSLDCRYCFICGNRIFCRTDDESWNMDQSNCSHSHQCHFVCSTTLY